METVGEYLKNERERQNRSLKDISTTTRISKTTLGAIEDGKMDLLPPQSYVRGFIRIYAAELELDPETVLQKYDAELQETVRWEPQKELKQTDSKSVRSRYPVFVAAGMVCLAAVAVLLWLLFARATPENKALHVDPPDHQAAQQAAPLPEIKPGDRPEPSPAPVPDSAEPEQSAEVRQDETIRSVAATTSVIAEPVAAAEFTLRFVARELTWMRLRIDDSEPFEIMLRAGETFSRTARETMKVRIGNVGGVSMYFNDTPVVLSAESDQPVNLAFPEYVQAER